MDANLTIIVVQGVHPLGHCIHGLTQVAPEFAVPYLVEEMQRDLSRLVPVSCMEWEARPWTD